MKVKVFKNVDLESFEKEINDFLDKKVDEVSSIDYGTYIEDDVTYFVAYLLYDV